MYFKMCVFHSHLFYSVWLYGLCQELTVIIQYQTDTDDISKR